MTERDDDENEGEHENEHDRVSDPAASRDRAAAAALYAEGCERERRQDYTGARDCYLQSLRLVEDDTVRAAFVKVLSAIGPA